MKSLFLIFAMIMLLSCQNVQKEEGATADMKSAEYPELLQKALNTHGGLSTWNDYHQLTFDLSTTLGEVKKEHQLIDLKTRKVMITGDGYKLGMDGQNVWVSPDKEAFGNMPPRFYHNLTFYFFSIPFVLADPGINYEDLGEKKVGGKTYRALKVTFNKGVGDADQDEYIAHFDPNTYQLKLLLYTVTYFDGQKHDNFNALLYEKWQKINGLLVPQIMIGHKYANDSIGAVRYKAEFSAVNFDKGSPGPSVFEMPEEAEIDSLKK